MNEVIVDLFIPAHEYLALYRGEVSKVIATSRDGRKISFPAQILKSFVTHSGVSGSFMIYFDHNNRFKRIERLH